VLLGRSSNLRAVPKTIEGNGNFWHLQISINGSLVTNQKVLIKSAHQKE
jgi:hypothetical protein